MKMLLNRLGNLRMRLVVACFISFMYSYSVAAPEALDQGFFVPTIEDSQPEMLRMQNWLEQKKNKQALIDQGTLEIQGTQPLFQLPIKNVNGDPGFFGITNYLDGNMSFPDQIRDYNCGVRSYDLTSGYNHQGIDFATWPFPWHKMDSFQVTVVAAADGVISFKQDGQFDRNCQTFGQRVDWNVVTITHADGSETWYGHLKQGSLTTKGIGDTVAAGEYLGVIGSSGASSGPHLHFETYDAAGNLVDPYAGPCNAFNESTWWLEQAPYYEPSVLKLATSATAPRIAQCPSVQDSPNFENDFAPGDTIYFGSYYRDQLSTMSTDYRIFRPDGSMYVRWNNTIDVFHYALSYWWRSFALPDDAPAGTWAFEARYNNEITRHEFNVSSTQGKNGFVINQGITGTWIDPNSSGAGLMIEIVPESQFIFIGWFTHLLTNSSGDLANPSDQWFSVQGNYQGNAAVDIPVFRTTGGEFATVTDVMNVPVGTITIEFADCNVGFVTYNLSVDGETISGQFEIRRFFQGNGNACESLNTQTQ